MRWLWVSARVSAQSSTWGTGSGTGSGTRLGAGSVAGGLAGAGTISPRAAVQPLGSEGRLVDRWVEWRLGLASVGVAGGGGPQVRPGLRAGDLAAGAGVAVAGGPVRVGARGRSGR